MRRFGNSRDMPIWTLHPRTQAEHAGESACTLAGEGALTQACLARAVRGLCELNCGRFAPDASCSTAFASDVTMRLQHRTQPQTQSGVIEGVSVAANGGVECRRISGC